MSEGGGDHVEDLMRVFAPDQGTAHPGSSYVVGWKTQKYKKATKDGASGFWFGPLLFITTYMLCLNFFADNLGVFNNFYLQTLV